MTETSLPRPGVSEYGEAYGPYVERVPDGDIVATLEAQMDETKELLASVPPEREDHRPAPGRWSVREVVGHLLDAERLFAFRALHVARGDGQPLPAMDQEAWAAVSNAAERPLAELVEEWAAVRRANVLFFASLDGAAGARRGVANGRAFTVRAFPWIVAGHELHHRELLRRDYARAAGVPTGVVGRVAAGPDSDPAL